VFQFYRTSHETKRKGENIAIVDKKNRGKQKGSGIIYQPLESGPSQKYPSACYNIDF
jgi:hypothetical protein